jgi:4-hydroxy-4-methyl-2-oxoglutarate aldolase
MEAEMSDLATRLGALPSAAVLDALPESTWVGQAIRPLWRPASIAAPAFTVQTRHGDNRPLHRAIAEATPGSVVVAATDASLDVAIFGDLLARVGAQRGLAGLVTDGAVRDSDGIRAAGFPVFCAGVALRAPVKLFEGIYGAAVRLGEAEVHAGDWIIGDSDGVVVVPRAVVERVATAAEGVERREAEIVSRAIAGESTVAQLGL